MNLLVKLLEHYSEEEIRDNIDKNQFASIKNDTKFTSLDTIAKKFDLKKIGYNLDDFLEDYPQYKKHKEIKTIFNVQFRGETISGLANKYNSTALFNDTKSGFDFNSNEYIGKKEILEFFDFDIDLSNFDIKVLRKHTELFGPKEKLENFREQFKITHPVLLDQKNDIWHLGFDGMLNDWIREIYLK